jgi:hypothetical protein
LHEALLRLVRDDPAATLGLLPPDAGLDLGAPVRLLPAELTEPVPLELRADLVLIVGEGSDRALGLVVEAQLQVDPDKQWTWPAYLALLRVRHKVPFGLVVLTPSVAVAAWAGRTITLGPGGALRPLVLGPDEVPAPHRSTGEHSSPTLLTLGALLHKASPARLAAALSALQQSAALSPDQRRLYIELILSATSPRARATLEAMMQTENQQDTLIFETLLACLVEAAQEQGQQLGIEEGVEKGVEIGIEKGVEIGIEKGVEIGIEKGVEIGIEKGVEIGIDRGVGKAARHAWALRFPDAPLDPAVDAGLAVADAAGLDAALQIIILATDAHAALAALRDRLGPASAPR